MMRLFLISLSFLILSCQAPARQDKSDPYNLTFSARFDSLNFGWTEEKRTIEMENFFGWHADRILGRDSVFCLTEVQLLDQKRHPLKAVFTQTIPLYGTEWQEADVTLHCRGKFLESAWLKVYSMDKQENLLRVDSVDVLGEGWRRHRLSISLKGVGYVQLAVVAEGQDCSRHRGAEMWIDRIDLEFDGEDAGRVNRPSASRSSLLDSNAVISLPSLEDSVLLTLPPFQGGSRMVGIGTFVHGSLALGHAANQIVKALVGQRNCKLVLVEMPSMQVLKWDFYIQGGSLPLTELKEDLTGSLWGPEEMAELLDMLRAYNRTAERKVHIVGFDQNNVAYYSLMHDYLYEKCKDKGEPIYRRFMQKLKSSKDMVALMKSKDEMSGWMNDFEVRWLVEQYWLNLIEGEIPSVKAHGAWAMRDFMMWQYAQNAILHARLQADESAVLLGHWTHLNKRNLVFKRSSSLGYYLSEKFGKDYFVLGLVPGQGTHAAWRERDVKACPLPSVEPGMLEYEAMQLGKPLFYYPVMSLPDTFPTRLRIQSAAYGGWSNRGCFLQNRMDGFIFLKDSEAFVCPGEESYNENQSKINMLIDRKKRWDAREKEMSFCNE